MGNNPCAYEKVSSDENFEINEKDQELLQISAEEGSITNHFDEKNNSQVFQNPQDLYLYNLCYVNLINYMDRYTVSGMQI